MDPRRVDAAVDLSYGVMILIAIVLMVVVGGDIGIAFGLGVLVSYGIHVVWKMARFDPQWMTQVVEESIEDVVGDTVDQSVEETVEETVEEAVEETVGEAVKESVEKAAEETCEEEVEPDSEA